VSDEYLLPQYQYRTTTWLVGEGPKQPDDSRDWRLAHVTVVNEQELTGKGAAGRGVMIGTWEVKS